MLSAKSQRRWFSPTPACLIYGLLIVEGLLWLSERYTWFGFNEKKGWTVLIAVAVVGVAMLVVLLWFAASLLFRWRFQFSIRLLLVLVDAVAMPFSWLAVEIKKTREEREAVDARLEAGFRETGCRGRSKFMETHVSVLGVPDTCRLGGKDAFPAI